MNSSAPQTLTPAASVDFSRLTETPEFTLLLDTIRARKAEIHEKRHVPRDIVKLMKDARIFRSSTPLKFGGDCLPAHHFLKMVDKIGEVDGSAAWVAAFGSANTYIAALPDEAQQVIYASGPDQVFAGGMYPLQKAERLDGGWKVSGQWKFASGCKGADWIGVGLLGAGHAAGSDSSGAPVVKMAVAPAAEVEIIENWDVMGMQGSGSFDTTVKDKFYSDAWTFERGAQGIYDDPIYRYPALAYQAQVHAACNLGLARAALDLAASMSGAAKIMPGATSLAERGYFKSGLADGEAKLRSARAFFYEMAEQGWDELLVDGKVSEKTTNLMRLSASHAARAGGETVEICFRIVGMGAVMESHPMQRYLRDSYVVRQHAALNDATFENAGTLLAGLPAPAGFP